MKKHLLGLGIFSFIVVSFAIAFAFFYAPKIREINIVKKTVIESDKRTSCDYSREHSQKQSFKIEQATINKKNRRFEAKTIEELNSNVKLWKLHFFVSDGKKIEQIATENCIANEKNCRIEKISQSSVIVGRIHIKFGDWIDKYDSKYNFYVIPEYANDEVRFDDEIKFDSKKAISVLLN